MYSSTRKQTGYEEVITFFSDAAAFKPQMDIGWKRKETPVALATGGFTWFAIKDDITVRNRRCLA